MTVWHSMRFGNAEVDTPQSTATSGPLVQPVPKGAPFRRDARVRAEAALAASLRTEGGVPSVQSRFPSEENFMTQASMVVSISSQVPFSSGG